jgi:hypothetical protein
LVHRAAGKDLLLVGAAAAQKKRGKRERAEGEERRGERSWRVEARGVLLLSSIFFFFCNLNIF